jgi:hypothetical protein
VVETASQEHVLPLDELPLPLDETDPEPLLLAAAVLEFPAEVVTETPEEFPVAVELVVVPPLVEPEPDEDADEVELDVLLDALALLPADALEEAVVEAVEVDVVEPLPLVVDEVELDLVEPELAEPCAVPEEE